MGSCGYKYWWDVSTTLGTCYYNMSSKDRDDYYKL